MQSGRLNWYFRPDDVVVNSAWGFDYTFCNSDCKNTTCGRNHGSVSYKEMCKTEPVHSEADFSEKCNQYESEEDLIRETLERR